MKHAYNFVFIMQHNCLEFIICMHAIIRKDKTDSAMQYTIHALCITFLLHINLQSYIHLKMKYFSVCPIQYCNGHNNRQYEALSNLQSVMQPYALVADTNACST